MYALLFSTLDAYTPPVHEKSRELKNQLNLTIPLDVVHASIESEDGNPQQSNPASWTAG